MADHSTERQDGDGGSGRDGDGDGTAVKLHFRTALLAKGWAGNVLITCRAGEIAAIELGAPPPSGAARRGIGLAGLCNLHSHAFQRAAAGLTEARSPAHKSGAVDNFWSWRETVYQLAARLTPDDLKAIAAMAQIEMLEAGFTRVGEFHCLHHGPDGAPYANIAAMAEALVAAALETGIGLTLLPVFYAHSDFGGAPPEPGQRRFVNSLARYQRLWEASEQAISALPDAVLGLAPHSLRAVTPDELNALVRLAKRGTGDKCAMPTHPMHIHIAEQRREVEAALSALGARPVEWLLDNIAVDESWCLIHATHSNDSEVERLARTGAVLGLCPITEANLGDGLFPAARYAALGGRYGVGSDSNVQITMAGELALLEYGQRLSGEARCTMASAAAPSTGRALYDAALAGGAQALGVRAGAGGGLQVGASADIIALDEAHIGLAQRAGDALLDSLIFASQPGMIAGVWRRGVQVVCAGRHHARPAIEAAFRNTMARLID